MANKPARTQTCRCAICGATGLEISHSLAVQHAKAERARRSSRPEVSVEPVLGVTHRPPPAFIIAPPRQTLAIQDNADHGMLAGSSNTTPISSLPPPSLRTPDILAELHEFLRTSYTRRLKFLGDPSTVRVYTPPSIREFLARPLNYAYELAANAASNQALLRDENRLREIAVEVARWTECNERQRISTLLEDVYQHMASQRVLAWTIQRDADEPNVVHPGTFDRMFPILMLNPYQTCFLTILSLIWDIHSSQRLS